MGWSHSIRLFVLGRLKRVGDHVSEQLMQKLRRPEVHPDTNSHHDLRVVVGINETGSEAQGNYAVTLNGFRHHVHVGNGNVGVTDFLSGRSYRQGLPALNHDLIRHQKSPIGKIYDVSSLNARNAGVQPS